jgi:hypothetical protein
LLAPAAAGQGIVTDRPDFTESTEVVPLHSLQAEAGLTVASDDDQEIVSGPELLLRFGLLDRLELRLEAPDYVDAGAGIRGFGDAAAGVKLQIGPLDDWGLAAIGMLTIPVGENLIGSGRVDPSFILTAAGDLPAGISLGAQLGVASSAGEADLSATLVAGTALAARVGTFAEVAGTDLAHDAGLLLHHGYTVSLGENAQFDVHLAAGLAGTAPDWLVGAGAAIRL